MNRLRDQIRRYMIPLDFEENSRASALLTFPRDFLGFKGHFPGNPILPGVCKVQAVLVMLEQWKHGTASLTEIHSAKFLGPVSAGEEIMLTCSTDPGVLMPTRVKGVFTRGGKKLSEIDLGVIMERESRGD